MIPREFIERVIEQTDLLELFRESGVEIKKIGSHFMACCPFHQEKTPSLDVSAQKNVYHCFACGAKGNALTFLKEKIGLTFVESIQHLAARLGLEVPDERGFLSDAQRQQEAREKEEKQAILNCLKRVALFYYRCLKNSPLAVHYCQTRSITGESAQKFALGYAPNQWNALSSLFPDYSTNPILKAAGLVIDKDGRRYDRFRNRLMIPILNKQGHVIAFGARILQEGEPKYLNSPETRVFEKGRELFGFYQAKQAMHEQNCAIVCEGYLDVMMLHQYGILNAVAALGTATTHTHIRQLLRYVDKIIFAFDGDLAGQKAAWRALNNALPELLDSKRLFFAFLPENADPDSFVRQNGKKAFEALCQNALPFSVFFLMHFENLHDLQTPETRAQFLENAAQTLRLLTKARLLQSQMVKEVAARTYFKEEEVWALVEPNTSDSLPGNAVPFLADSGVKEAVIPLKTRLRKPFRLDHFWRGLLECVIAEPILIEDEENDFLLLLMQENLDNSLNYSLLLLILNIKESLSDTADLAKIVEKTEFAQHFEAVRHDFLDDGAGSKTSAQEFHTRWRELIHNLDKALQKRQRSRKK